MNALIKIKNLPPAPAPTKPYTSTEYYTCIDGSVFRRPSTISKDLHLAVTPQTKASSKEARNKDAYEKWDRMAVMARAGWEDKEIAEATGYTVSYVRKRLQLMRANGADIPVEFARKEEKRISSRELAIELRKQGKTYEEISKETGLTYNTVRRYLSGETKWIKH